MTNLAGQDLADLRLLGRGATAQLDLVQARAVHHLPHLRRPLHELPAAGELRQDALEPTEALREPACAGQAAVSQTAVRGRTSGQKSVAGVWT